jgi:hypothetical protein
MALTRLISPAGEEVLVSRGHADEFRGRGYTDPGSTPKTKPKAKKETGKPADEKPEVSDKPLEALKLAELIEHAEKVGVPAETIATLRKPGASKKAAIAAITAATEE